MPKIMCAHQLEFCTDGVGASELRVMLEGSSVTRPFVTIFGRYFDDECYTLGPALRTQRFDLCPGS